MEDATINQNNLRIRPIGTVYEHEWKKVIIRMLEEIKRNRERCKYDKER